MQTNLRKTKIVATIGPGSESKENFTKLLRAGVNVARTNMSHDDQEIHGQRIKNIRAVSKKEGIPCALLVDLSGPKIRIGDFAESVVELVAGEKIILSGTKCEGTKDKVYFNYPHIKTDIKVGQVLMLDDGKKKLVVDKVVGDDVYTTIVVGGKTKSRRGVNIPGAYLSISALTDKDKKDLKFAIENGADFIALSFVRTAKDIEQLRTLIKKLGGKQLIIAKMETEEAIENMDAIIEASDAVMVARGDLAVEVGPERVPPMQKMIVRKCNDLGKPVIVATQMLESMINAPVPTRAEVSDVANAIFDGADAVMLSEESSLGAFAVEAVTVMNNVALNAEGSIHTHRRHKVQINNSVDSVSSSVVHNAEDVDAKIIAAFTETGFTARMIARHKPAQPIIVLTWEESVARTMLLSYGCYPVVIKRFKTIEQMIKLIGLTLIKTKLIKKDELFVLSTGLPINQPIKTNAMVILSA